MCDCVDYYIYLFIYLFIFIFSYIQTLFRQYPPLALANQPSVFYPDRHE